MNLPIDSEIVVKLAVPVIALHARLQDAQALGLNMSGMTDELRRRFSLKDDLKGVVITRVDPNSSASDKRIQAGEVIVEVNQEPVTNPTDVTKKIDDLKSQGRKSALLLVANAQGEVRFVALSIE